MQKYTLEVWKAIRNYEGLYEVSNWGRVKSVERIVESHNQHGKYMSHRKERILRAAPDDNGYLVVVLHKNGVGKPKKVHKLVADAFIENPNNYTDVHHINHDNRDNRIENLEWMSEPEHVALHNKESKSKTVYQLEGDEIVNIWESASEAARTLGFNVGNICKCCKGGYFYKGKWVNITQSYGYGWSYSPLYTKKRQDDLSLALI